MMKRSNKQVRRIVIAAIALGAALSSCITTTRTALVAIAPGSECVVLLHGLNRSWRAMEKMADALQAAGYSTANVDYPSQ